MSSPGLAGVVLAAGRGERLRPLTDLLPKPLCPIANRPLLDLALDRLRPHVGEGSDRVAVNAHYLPTMIRDAVSNRTKVSVEKPVALGTAGALGRLRSWIDGRDVLLTNADAYLPGGLDGLVESWDRTRIRLLVKEIGQPSDFGSRRYVGACLLPWSTVAGLSAEPSGLFEALWRLADERGAIDFVDTTQAAIDCGRPRDYLAANLQASGGTSVIGTGAVVEGTVERCVVWADAVVGPDEHLVDVIRAGTRHAPITVTT